MFGLIAAGIYWGVAGAIGVVGHKQARKFVGRRLRFTKVVEKPAVSVAAGLGTTAAVAVTAPLLPFVGAATAVVAGVGVATGVALGSRDAKKPPPLIED